jgi:hypothetical protein
MWVLAKSQYTLSNLSDNLHCSIRTQAEEDFITAQIHKEVLVDRYSEDFGLDLLPGMYCLPIHTISKPGGNTFQLINDQSAGEYSLDSMIT